jgi:hypothetical protein
VADGLGGFIAAFVEYLERPEGLLTIGGAIVSGASAIWAARSNNKVQAAQRQMQEESLRIGSETLRANVDAQILGWGEQMILLLAEAHALALRRGAYGDPSEYARARDVLAARISGYIDQGRLFFLNDSADLVGLDRPVANRGYRPPVLDAAMLVYREVCMLDPAGSASAGAEANAIFQMRRAFISELQKALDPRRRRAVLDRLVSNRVEQEEVEKLDEELSHVDTVTWEDVAPLVDEFEKRHGERSFWGERPRPRSEVLRDTKD